MIEEFNVDTDRPASWREVWNKWNACLEKERQLLEQSKEIEEQIKVAVQESNDCWKELEREEVKLREFRKIQQEEKRQNQKPEKAL